MKECEQELGAVSNPDWELAVERSRLLAPLAELDRCTVDQVDAVARELQISRAMVYRLLGRFRNSPQTSSLLPSKPGRKEGAKELSPAQERIIRSVIDDFYLSKQKPSVAASHRTIAFQCAQSDVPIPSYYATRARILELDPGTLIRRREGAKTAAHRFRPVKGSLVATEPLEIVQLDHTPVDVIVVDEWRREPIGRPWLSVAIDVATRTVPGFYLSLKRPSAHAVAMVISRAVLSKTPYLRTLHIEADWPMVGLPRVLHLDNAKEFSSRALLRGCQEYGIEIVHRPPDQPHFGGHVERLIGTLMGEVHLLPGTTFRSIEQRGEYNSAHHATMTMQELETWLVWQIAGVYHQKIHSALGRTPQEAWAEGVQKMGQPLREPVDPKRFYTDFLPFQKRFVGRDGLRLFNILYWHGALSRYVQDSQKHLVKYDARDLSRVYFLEPGGSYLEVPYRDLARQPVSLGEVQQGAKILRARGETSVNEGKLFQAILKQRAILHSAKGKTLKARRQAQEVAEIKRMQLKPKQQPSKLNSEPDEPVDPFPFEIWYE